MSSTIHASSYYIGWDVGGWNCDRNRKSRDALVILDADLNLIGQPWRGNLRATINAANSSADWISRLFALCRAKAPTDVRVMLGIDTPLGFPEMFVRLVTRQIAADEIGLSSTNPYLFRRTERFLLERGLKPLSTIKDMIGSQATKGMHVLSRFAPQVRECGVWRDGDERLTAIETYPSACKHSTTVEELQQRFEKWAHDDLVDARICALVAYLFATQPDSLVEPQAGVPMFEGWIWIPRDRLDNERGKK